jgi:hypothetical protein
MLYNTVICEIPHITFFIEKTIHLERYRSFSMKYQSFPMSYRSFPASYSHFGTFDSLNFSLSINKKIPLKKSAGFSLLTNARIRCARLARPLMNFSSIRVFARLRA